MSLFSTAIKQDIESYLAEDDLKRNLYYLSQLPQDSVQCQLNIKSDLVLAGLPWFVETFNVLAGDDLLSYENFSSFEGQSFLKGSVLKVDFNLPFSIALTGERIALNLLQRSSSIASYTKMYVDKAEKYKTKILDTRKTTPGLRALEKYSVRMGGGSNHRLGQADMWMIKDNHKAFFGGVKEAVEFFQSQEAFYQPIELEIHDLGELTVGVEMGVKHFMLDNFSPEDIVKAVAIKPSGVTYEVSGGVNLATLDHYLMDGVDAISVGGLTYRAPAVDLSFKYSR